MITNIEIQRIKPHPDNPRKNLGDLTELADSIKVSGILQNLTVVPEDPERYKRNIDSKHAYTGDYIAVIGHRRHAAAKLAGLTEVPCTVTDMDAKTQITTMLTENMQRSDLTILEQAQGFQLMLDLGETMGGISKKTGVSENTVRGRIKLLELDPDKFKAAVERGGTLQDYAELDKIKNAKLKNNVLEKIGTSNFQWELKNAITIETRAENKAALIAELNNFAEKVKDVSKLVYADYISLDKDSFKKPEDAGNVKYFYTVSDQSIMLYKEKTKADAKKEVSEAERKAKERKKRAADITRQAYELRYEFIKGFTSVKKHAAEIAAFAVQAIIRSSFYSAEKTFMDLLGIELGENERFSFEKIAEYSSEPMERVLLIAAYSAMDGPDMRYYQEWQDCKYCQNKNLDAVYGFLETLGYTPSDEERALCDGTHEMFRRDDKEPA